MFVGVVGPRDHRRRIESRSICELTVGVPSVGLGGGVDVLLTVACRYVGVTSKTVEFCSSLTVVSLRADPTTVTALLNSFDPVVELSKLITPAGPMWIETAPLYVVSVVERVLSWLGSVLCSLPVTVEPFMVNWPTRSFRLPLTVEDSRSSESPAACRGRR